MNIVIKFFISILLFFTLQTFSQEKIKNINSTLQGYWKMSDIDKETLLIKNDSIIFYNERKIYQKSRFKIYKEVLIDSILIKGKKGEYIFRIFDGNLITNLYLLGHSKNEFSFMYFSNGQTIVYKKSTNCAKSSR
jgi:hypothetical protein